MRRKFPLEKGPKRPQKRTIIDECAQIAESGLKPPFESPPLDFPPKYFEQINYVIIQIECSFGKHLPVHYLVVGAHLGRHLGYIILLYIF